MYTILYYRLIFNGKVDALVDQTEIIGSILLIIALNGLMIISRKYYLSNNVKYI